MKWITIRGRCSRFLMFLFTERVAFGLDFHLFFGGMDSIDTVLVLFVVSTEGLAVIGLVRVSGDGVGV